MPNNTEGNPAKRPKDWDNVVAEAALTCEEIHEESVSTLRDCETIWGRRSGTGRSAKAITHLGPRLWDMSPRKLHDFMYMVRTYTDDCHEMDAPVQLSIYFDRLVCDTYVCK